MNRSGSSPVDGGPRVDVAVVIPTYRRPDLLSRCLVALARQTIAPDRYEIVIADDDPTGPLQVAVIDAIDAVRQGAPDGPAIRRIRVTTTQGPAGARNAGWREATAPVIAFTDDDTIPNPTWLEQGLAALAAGLDAAGGRITMPLHARPTDYERDASHLAEAEFATANCFVRRDALVAVGGFDERFTSAWREDSDLQFTLIERGFRVGMADRAEVMHPIRPERAGISIREQKKAFFDALLVKKHPALCRERLSTSAPWHYYVSVAALLASIVALAVGAWPVAAAAVAVWLVLGLRFAMLRLANTSRAPGHVVEMIVTSLALPPLSLYWRLRGALFFRVAFL